MRAPATIHWCWYSQWLTFAFVGFGFVSSHVESACARSGSGISFSGSVVAPVAANAGGRCCGQAAFGATFFVACAATAFFSTCGVDVLASFGRALVAGTAACGILVVAAATSASWIAVPAKGDAFSGVPTWRPPALSWSTIVGAPVS